MNLKIFLYYDLPLFYILKDDELLGCLYVFSSNFMQTHGLRAGQEGVKTGIGFIEVSLLNTTPQSCLSTRFRILHCL